METLLSFVGEGLLVLLGVFIGWVTRKVRALRNQKKLAGDVPLSRQSAAGFELVRGYRDRLDAAGLVVRSEYIHLNTSPNPPLRLPPHAHPRRAVVQALLGPLQLSDDSIRTSWQVGEGSMIESEVRVRLVYGLLRLPDDPGAERSHTLGAELAVLVQSLDRGVVLGMIFEHLRHLPGLEAVARLVQPGDLPTFRLGAALILGEAEPALALAAREDVPFELRLEAVERFFDPAQAAPILARLLLLPAARARVLAQVRRLPLAQALEILEPVAQRPDAFDALALLEERAPEVALPHIQAVAQRSTLPTHRLRAATLLHRFDPVAAERVLIELLEVPDTQVDAALELGQLGTHRAIAPLTTVARFASEPLSLAVRSALEDLQARQNLLPGGGLSLAEERGGGLSEVPTREADPGALQGLRSRQAGRQTPGSLEEDQ